MNSNANLPRPRFKSGDKVDVSTSEGWKPGTVGMMSAGLAGGSYQCSYAVKLDGGNTIQAAEGRLRKRS